MRTRRPERGARERDHDESMSGCGYGENAILWIRPAVALWRHFPEMTARRGILAATCAWKRSTMGSLSRCPSPAASAWWTGGLRIVLGRALDEGHP